MSAVFLVVNTLPGPTVELTFDAPRARSFTLLHQGPGETAFSVLADGLTVRTFEHTSVTVGAHHYKVVPHNNAGNGAESVVLEVAVSQQAAA